MKWYTLFTIHFKMDFDMMSTVTFKTTSGITAKNEEEG